MPVLRLRRWSYIEPTLGEGRVCQPALVIPYKACRPQLIPQLHLLVQCWKFCLLFQLRCRGLFIDHVLCRRLWHPFIHSDETRTLVVPGNLNVKMFCGTV